jgi:hypothetical protein
MVRDVAVGSTFPLDLEPGQFAVEALGGDGGS